MLSQRLLAHLSPHDHIDHVLQQLESAWAQWGVQVRHFFILPASIRETSAGGTHSEAFKYLNTAVQCSCADTESSGRTLRWGYGTHALAGFPETWPHIWFVLPLFPNERVVWLITGLQEVIEELYHSRERMDELVHVAHILRWWFEHHYLADAWERQYQRLRHFYQDLFERIPTGIYRSTPEGTILAANPALVRLLGYDSIEEIVQLNARDLYVHPEDRDRWRRRMDTEDEVRNFETQFRRKDGTVIWVMESARTVRDETGQVLYYEGVLEDITLHKLRDIERQQRWERLQRFHEIIVELAMHPHLQGQQLDLALKTLTRRVAQALDVERVNVWQVSADGSYLVCLQHYDPQTNRHVRGFVVDLRSCPTYFQHLQADRVIAASDVTTDPRTSELSETYWKAWNVCSTIDVPIRVHGTTIGVICIEKQGIRRDWTPEEINFATDVGDLAAQIFLNHEIHQRAQYLWAINQMALAVQQAPSLTQWVERFLQELAGLTQARFIYVRCHEHLWCWPLHEQDMLRPELDALLQQTGYSGESVRILYRWQWSMEISPDVAGTDDDLAVLICIPLCISDDSGHVGGIVIGSARWAWRADELTMLHTVAQQFRQSFQYLQLQRESIRHTALMEQLLAFSEELNRPRSVQDTLELIGQAARQLTQADGCAIYVRTEAGQIVCPWYTGVSEQYIQRILDHVYEVPGSRVLQSTEPVIVENVLRDIPEHAVVRKWLLEEGFQAFGVWPIAYEGRALAAVVTYFRRPRNWSPVEKEVMHTLLRHAGAAYANAQLLARVQEVAQRDPVTGLYNRRYFEDALDRAIATARRQQLMHGVLYLDLDYFRSVNDAVGFHQGDMVLRTVGEILQERIHEGDVLARLGGDEFGVLLYNSDDRATLEFAEHLRAYLHRITIPVESAHYPVSVSIGIATVDAAARSATEVLSQAETACMQAKRRGRNCVHRFVLEDARQPHLMVVEMRTAQAIRRALEEGQLCLYFQPIYHLKTSRTFAFEALVRMEGPDGKIQPAGRFIPIAERFGLTPELDRWVLQRVFDTYQQYSGHIPDLRIAVNLSGQTLEHSENLEFIKQLFEQHGPPPGAIILEITESTALAQILKAIDFIEELRKLGVAFALDDFGIGFSTFSHLRRLPVQFMKIDRTFIYAMDQSDIDAVLVESMHRFAHTLGIETVAEGVETRSVLQRLRQIGIDYVQGFLFGMPMPEPLSPPERLPPEILQTGPVAPE